MRIPPSQSSPRWCWATRCRCEHAGAQPTGGCATVCLHTVRPPHAPPISSGCTLCPVRGTTPRRALADKDRLLELDERRARARANLLAVAATEQLEAAVRAEQQAEAKVRAGWRLAAQQRGSGAGSLVVFLFVSSCCCSPAAEASSAG